MKHPLLGILLAFLLVPVSVLHAQDKRNIVTVVYDVGLNDTSQYHQAEKNMTLVEGVEKVTTDVGEKTVCVVYDGDKTSDEKIIDAFRGLGYQASVKTSCCCKVAPKCCDGTCTTPTYDASGKKHCDR